MGRNLPPKVRMNNGNFRRKMAPVVGNFPDAVGKNALTPGRSRRQIRSRSVALSQSGPPPNSAVPDFAREQNPEATAPRPRRRPIAAEWELSAWLDAQRQLLLAQRQRALSFNCRGSIGLCCR
jgi:hypothetical protein